MMVNEIRPIGGDSVDNLATCDACGRVALVVTRDYATDEVRRFNEYYDTLDTETQSHFGGRSSLDHYAYCLCGKTNFHPATPGEAKRANGHTINPVVLDLGAISER